MTLTQPLATTAKLVNKEQAPLQLATRHAKSIFLQIKNKIKTHIILPESEPYLEEFSPTTNISEIHTRHLQQQEQQTRITPELITLLQTHMQTAASLSPQPIKKCNTIVLACGDVETYKRVKEELNAFVPVSLVERDQDVFDLLSYEQIRIIPGDECRLSASVEELDNVIVFSKQATLEEIFPEKYMLALEQQPEAVQALNALAPILTTRIPHIRIGKKQKEISAESIRVQLEKDCNVLQETIDKVLETEQFSGAVFSSIMQEETTLFNELSPASKLIITGAKEDSASIRKTEWNFAFTESIQLNATGKAVIDEETFQQELKNALFAEKEEERKGRSGTANAAKTLLHNLPKIQEELYRLDVQVALKQFSETHNLEFPELINQGVEFVFGKNMNITNAVPVEYYLSETQPTAILTGANSGGKTTLMELLAQIQILTQMGLGVPAKQAKVAVVKQLYYFSKSKGTLGAGAFETMLEQFAKLAKEKNTEKLVLADEIESVTEPDIAAKIIKGILVQLQQHHKTSTLLVTHVGRELKKLNSPARFDGIEAKGLAADFSLVVDRNPVIGKIARSTPQLIIERLAKTKSNPFYQELYTEINK